MREELIERFAVRLESTFVSALHARDSEASSNHKSNSPLAESLWIGESFINGTTASSIIVDLWKLVN